MSNKSGRRTLLMRHHLHPAVSRSQAADGVQTGLNGGVPTRRGIEGILGAVDRTESALGVAVQPEILLGVAVVEAQLSDQECISIYPIDHAMFIGYAA